MQRAVEIIRLTDRKIKERADKWCKLLSFKVTKAKDNVNRPYVKVVSTVKNPPPYPPWASGREHIQEFHFYPPSGQRSPIWMTCTCENFLYVDEVALSIKGSTDVIHSNGKFPKIKNPLGVPQGCKHIVKALRRALIDGNVRNYLNQIQTLVYKDVKLRKRMPV